MSQGLVVAPRVRRVDGTTGIITTVAGNGTAGFTGDGGPAVDAQLQDPNSLAIEASGNLYVNDLGHNRIRRRDASTGIIATVAGNGPRTGSIDGEGGDPSDDLGDGRPAIEASLNPRGIALDASGNLFIADGPNNRVRVVDAVTGVVTTVAGNGDCCFSGDGGPATSANLGSPFGVTVDAAGNLFIASIATNRVRMVDSASGIITTVAGSGPPELLEGSYSSDGGPATSATLDAPIHVAVDDSGNLFIADLHNHVVRMVEGVAAAGVCGDQNDDGKVDVFDAIIDLQIIVGLIEPTPPQMRLSDVVRDGVIDVFDVIFLLQHIVGLTEITECGPPLP